MANVWTRFQELLPNRSQQIGEVATVHPDGTSTITLPTGATVRVIGDQVAAGNSALIEGNRIVAPVPTLPTLDAEV